MKWKAVIFDFFGTLVGNFSIGEHNQVLSRMAEVLSVPRDDFARMWVETFPDRATGVIPTIEANIEYICRALGCSVTGVQMTAASDIRLHFYRRSVRPRPGVLEALIRLKAEGYRVGLITDCSSELPKLWSSTPFASLIDVAVFSCCVGVRKPDPRIYRLACKRLGVVPQDCLYVGDGSSRELTGASAVGMQPLLIRPPYEETHDFIRIDVEEWSGPSVSHISDILTFIKSAQGGEEQDETSRGCRV
jgi:putative hydrolase of the HAD superfamily